MSEWGRSGGRLPNPEESTREHFDQVAQDVRHEREADRVAPPPEKRPWWRFWAKRRPA
ncbi:MAG: hypothetical protein L0206_00825 [Actinobacteria bacterium]|nr:hypothetical protein [Actinomycetota bacterium]